MGCGVYWNQVNEIERALSTLRRYGISEAFPAYQKLFKIRGKLLAQIGFKFPRIPSLLSIIPGLSPGVIKLWHDPESGWMSEARAKPGAPPVYHHVTDDVAMALLKKELTHELEVELMTPDEYIGE